LAVPGLDDQHSARGAPSDARRTAIAYELNPALNRCLSSTIRCTDLPPEKSWIDDEVPFGIIELAVPGIGEVPPLLWCGLAEASCL
jgi:hypothetical protein